MANKFICLDANKYIDSLKLEFELKLFHQCDFVANEFTANRLYCVICPNLWL